MSLQQLSLNTEQIQGFLGRVSRAVTLNKVAAIINPASAASLSVGDTVKLSNGTPSAMAQGPIQVDKHTGPTDTAAVFGVIIASPKQNEYAAGQEVLLALTGTFISLLASAAIQPGTKVSTTVSTGTTDPTVATDATTGHQITGIAVGYASAAGQFVEVQVNPSTNP